MNNPSFCLCLGIELCWMCPASSKRSSPTTPWALGVFWRISINQKWLFVEQGSLCFSRTLLLLFQSKCVGLWESKLIFFLHYCVLFCLQKEMLLQEKRSVQLFWLNCVQENFMSVGLNKKNKQNNPPKKYYYWMSGIFWESPGFIYCRFGKTLWPATWKEKLYSCVAIMRNSYVMKSMCLF